MKQSPVRTGFKKGLLTVIAASKAPKDAHGHMKWTCLCECGSVVDQWGADLARGVASRDPVALRTGATCGEQACRKLLRDRENVRSLGGVARQEAYAAETIRIRSELARMGVGVE